MESESASSIAIAKENLTRLANYRRIAVEENVNTNDGSVAVFLSLVDTESLIFLNFVIFRH